MKRYSCILNDYLLFQLEHMGNLGQEALVVLIPAQGVGGSYIFFFEAFLSLSD
jgi:hypothetical protein